MFAIFFKSSIQYKKLNIDENNEKSIELIENNHIDFSLHRCVFIPKDNKVCYQQNIKQTTITNTSVLLDKNEIKFEYISHFKNIFTNSIKIYVFSRISDKKTLNIYDDISIVLLHFVDNHERTHFIKTFFKKVNIYKKNNNYDKNVINFKFFKIFHRGNNL